ncbi:MAG: CHAD domain-containing protein, partial [Burkholderiaceae bacterium]|nr:CHAD domain-containing protein [Burkholderiaceae bacterium]
MGTRQEPAVATRSTRDKSAPPGGALAAVHAPAPVNARPLALNATLTLAAAFERILHNCLDQVQANVAGVLARDAECLHQMRVGLRRLRAALNLFKQMAPLPAALQHDLDWLAALLGKARDWDVFLSSTLDAVGGDAWQAGRSALRDCAARHATTAHQAVQAALRSARHTRLVRGLSGWIIDQPWRQPDHCTPNWASAPARKALRPLLAQAQRRLHQRLRQATADDPASLHRVRIAAKKARYTAQFFQSLLPPKP